MDDHFARSCDSARSSYERHIFGDIQRFGYPLLQPIRRPLISFCNVSKQQVKLIVSARPPDQFSHVRLPLSNCERGP